MSSSGGRIQTPSGVSSLATALGNPAAGADWSSAAPAALGLLAVRAQLVTSATVANRFPMLQVVDGSGNVLVEIPAANAQAASLTEIYQWGQGLTSYQANTRNVQPIPLGLVVPAGGHIQTVTTGIQAGDQWSLIVLTTAG